MKKLLLLIILLCSFTCINAQQIVSTKFECYFFSPEIDLNNTDKITITEAKIGTIPGGKFVEVLSLDTVKYLFYKVLYQNRIGYIHKDVLTDASAINKLIYKRDSINKVEKLKQDSILKVKLDSIAFEKEKKISLYKDSLYLSCVKRGMPVEIFDMKPSYPNSAGGVDLIFRYKNLSKKDIKYISLTGYVSNNVGDKCYCTIRDYSSTTIRDVGPIKYDKTDGGYWENVWYNHTIRKFVPTSIKIIYMNGSTVTMNKNKIEDATAITTPQSISDYKDSLRTK